MPLLGLGELTLSRASNSILITLTTLFPTKGFLILRILTSANNKSENDLNRSIKDELRQICC